MNSLFFKSKLFCFSLFIIFGINSILSQENIFPKDDNKKIVFTEVVVVENVNKDVLFARAIEWFAKTFASAQNVLQMQDKEMGRIVGKGNFEVAIGLTLGRGAHKGIIKFTITINFKDGRYKYEITDFYHEGTFAPGTRSNISANGGALENETPACGKPFFGSGGLRLSEWNQIKEMAYFRVKEIIEDLKKSMSKESSGDNW